VSPSPPLIGIPAMKTRSGAPPHSPLYAIPPAYSAAIVRGGGAPLAIPQGVDQETLRGIFDRLDGILLAGGGDVDPVLYGETAGDKIGDLDRERDDMEIALSRWAVEAGTPLLAICRGIQVLNVALGGTLYQDLLADMPGAMRHDFFQSRGYARDYCPHDVRLSNDSYLAQLMGRDRFPVNSLHHQGLKRLGPELTAAGHAPDGLVEAVEVVGHVCAVGVQWHPEALAEQNPIMQGVFDAFVRAARVEGG
jgi:putative glutamine amidotransferase